MGWIYYYVSFLSGTIELGTLVWGLSHGYGLMEVLGLVMAYQLGNVVLYTVPARVEKRAWAFLAGAVFLFLAGAFLPAAHDVRYALVWVSFAVASTFLQLEREAVKVKVAQWKKWKKRAFRVLGFLASALISTAAGTALVAVYMVSLLVLGFVLPEFGYDGWLRRLAAGQLGQPRVCWAMVTHQAHYFAYTYVLFAIACAYYGGTLVPVLWFVANWVPYTITEPLVRTLKLWTAPDCADSTKKPRVQEYSVLAGVAQRQRRHSCFALDTFVVVKVDVTVDHLVGFRKGGRFVAVDAFCFENGEEIFRHCIVIRVPTS